MTQTITHRRTHTRYFFDTEFIEDGSTIDLVSIGIVREDGREYYAVSEDADHTRANQWVRDNVLAQLPLPIHPAWRPRRQIAHDIVDFVGSTKPEFWAYYAAYDHVALAQLFGPMIGLPPNLPMHCMDLKQYAVMLGNPKLPTQKKGLHSALQDARWNRDIYNWLRRR